MLKEDEGNHIMHVTDQTKGQKSCYRWQKREDVVRKVNSWVMLIDWVLNIDQGNDIRLDMMCCDDQIYD